MAPMKISTGTIAYMKKLTKNIFDTEREQHATCPISHDLFIDPVFCVGDGITYEKSYLKRWLDDGKTVSLLHGAPLQTLDYIPNLAMRNLADSMRKEPLTPEEEGERSNEIVKATIPDATNRIAQLERQVRDLENEPPDDDNYVYGREDGSQDTYTELDEKVGTFWGKFKEVFGEDLKDDHSFRQKLWDLRVLDNVDNGGFVCSNDDFPLVMCVASTKVVNVPPTADDEITYEWLGEHVLKIHATDYLQKLDGLLLEARTRLQGFDNLLVGVEPDRNMSRVHYNMYVRQRREVDFEVRGLQSKISALTRLMAQDDPVIRERLIRERSYFHNPQVDPSTLSTGWRFP